MYMIVSGFGLRKTQKFLLPKISNKIGEIFDGAC